MKKFFLIIFFIIPMYAGRPFINDPEAMINQYKCVLIRIRTQFGYEFPPEEREKITFEEKAKLFREFRGLWKEFSSNRISLKNYFRSIPAKQLFYFDFFNELLRDKNRYEFAMDKELKKLNRSNGSNP